MNQPEEKKADAFATVQAIFEKFNQGDELVSALKTSIAKKVNTDYKTFMTILNNGYQALLDPNLSEEEKVEWKKDIEKTNRKLSGLSTTIVYADHSEMLDELPEATKHEITHDAVYSRKALQAIEHFSFTISDANTTKDRLAAYHDALRDLSSFPKARSTLEKKVIDEFSEQLDSTLTSLKKTNKTIKRLRPQPLDEPHNSKEYSKALSENMIETRKLAAINDDLQEYIPDTDNIAHRDARELVANVQEHLKTAITQYVKDLTVVIKARLGEYMPEDDIQGVMNSLNPSFEGNHYIENGQAKKLLHAITELHSRILDESPMDGKMAIESWQDSLQDFPSLEHQIREHGLPEPDVPGTIVTRPETNPDHQTNIHHAPIQREPLRHEGDEHQIETHDLAEPRG